MLRTNSKVAVPFLCCCFWTIIFSIFLSFYVQLIMYTTHTKIGEGESCVNNIPIQTQYQLIKTEYAWKGIGNITNTSLRQECPDSQVTTKVYTGNVYKGGTYETNDSTFILDCRREIMYTISNSTLYNSSGNLIGRFNFENSHYLLSTPDGELLAQWYFDSHTLTLLVHSNTIDQVLLFSIAGKYAFGDYNECTTKYWMSLQIVIISGILSLASIVMTGIGLLNQYGKDYRYSRKTINLSSFNKKRFDIK